MSDRTLRWLGPGLISTAAAGVFGLTATMTAAGAHGDTDFNTTTPDVGVVIGGSGDPIPGAGYVEAANGLYIDPNITGVTEPGTLADGLFTPEGLFPLEGPYELTLNQSVAEGVTILNDQIENDIKAGDVTTVFAYSQSAEIASQEMTALAAAGEPSSKVNFVLVGDVDNPDGGLLERFAGLSLPSLGITFNGATPSDLYPTDIYTLEYDGFADFPQYPSNVLADLNAFLGISEIHGTYLDGGVDGEGPTATQIADAIPLTTSGATDTSYFMIPETAPLVSLLDEVSPTLGTLLGPDLTYLINLGYGDGATGYSTGPANVATPFGLSPDVSLSTELQTLEADTEEGYQNLQTAMADGTLSSVGGTTDTTTSSSSSLTELLTALETAVSSPSDFSTFTTDLSNAFAGAEAAIAGAQESSQDVMSALTTSLPSYELSLFTENESNLADALGYPLAADTGLTTLAAGFEVEIAENALTTISTDFSTAFANLMP